MYNVGDMVVMVAYYDSGNPNYPIQTVAEPYRSWIINKTPLKIIAIEGSGKVTVSEPIQGTGTVFFTELTSFSPYKNTVLLSGGNI